MKLVLILFIAIASFSAFSAGNLESYKKRFRVIRDEEGRALRIIDRSLHTRLSFTKFSQTYHGWFISEESNLLAGSQFLNIEAEIESRELSRQLTLILDQVKKYKLENIIAGNSFKRVNTFLKGEFKKVSTVGFRTVSNLENTTFFFQNKHYKKISLSAKKEAQKFFPKEHDEKVVQFLIERYIGFLKDSRTYHQSILLHYLTNYSSSELGLSKQEIGMAMSSILEGDIKIHNIFSRRRLKKNWETYGQNKLKEIASESMKKVIKFRDIYEHTPYFANPYFARTKMKRGEEVWINPYFQNKALDNSPSLSFDYARPEYVYKKRRYFELLIFSQVQSGGAGKIKKYFSDLKYRRQMLKEGMLYGFYESRGDDEMMKKLLKQSLNPLETIFKIPE